LAVPIVRTVIMYLCVIFAVRLMGKRQVGDLEPAELVVTILISETAAIPIQETGVPLINVIVPVFLLVCLEIIVSYILLKSVRLRTLFTGKPIVIIKNGKLMEKEMRKVRLTVDDLMNEIRQKNIFYVEQISYAVMETNGKISILPKPEQLPLVTGDFDKQTPDGGLPMVIVSDGVIADSSLSLCGLDRAWLNNTLKTEGLALHEVLLMTADRLCQYHIFKKEEAS